MRDPDPDPRSTHWETVYRTKAADAVSWHRKHLDVSIGLLERGGLGVGSRVIDVGGGASTLVDDLFARGVGRVTVLDLSAAALEVAKARLGVRAAQVDWRVGDVTRIALPAGHFSAWHDRAVLHFLTREEEARAYARQAAAAVASGGIAVVGGFAPDGPMRCSGLDVARRSAEDIARLLAPSFRPLDTRREMHRTPGGALQAFEYVLLERT